MDIAALSMRLSAAQLHQQIQMAVQSITMETSAELSQNFAEEVLKVPPSAEGARIDISI